MKKLLSILLILAALISRAQTPIYVPQSGSVTPYWPHMAFKSVKIPVYQDTAHALFAAGIDSIGLIFKELNTSKVWVRDSNLVAGGHVWTLVGPGSGGGSSFDSSTSQGGGFHTQPYNDVRYLRSIPNFQQTLIAGPNLSKADTINQANHALYFSGRGSTLVDSLSLHSLNTYWGADTIINSGNSITLGAASYDGVHGYAFKLDSFFNRPFVNLGTSGAEAAYITQKNYSYEDYTKDSKYGLTIMAGINDLGTAGNSAAVWQNVWSGINSMFANHFAKDTVSCSAGSGVLRYGSLTSYTGKATDGLKATNVLYSNTKNDSVAWNFTDSTFIFFSAATDGNSGAAARYAGGVFKIVIDGVQVARRSINGIATGLADAYYAGHLIPYCVIVTGLSYGPHHVVVSNDSTGGYVYFDCFGNLKDHFAAFPLTLFHVTHSDKGPALYLSTDSLNAKLDSSAYASWPLDYPWSIVNSNRNLDTSAAGGMISPSDHLHPLELGHAVIFQNAIDDIFPAPGGMFYSGVDNNPYIVLKNVNPQTTFSGTQPFKVAVGSSIGGTVTAGTIPEGAAGNTLTNSPLVENVGTITQISPNAAYKLRDNTSSSQAYIYNYQHYFMMVMNGGYDPNIISQGIWMYCPAAGNGGNMQFYVGNSNGALPAQPHMALYGDGNLVLVNGSAGVEYSGAAIQTGGIRPGISFMYGTNTSNQSWFQQLSNGILQFSNDSVTLGLAAPTAAKATLNLPAGASPVSPNQGDLWPATGHLYYRDGSTTHDLLAASGVTTVGTFSGSSQANGASISGSTITFGPADAANPGMVTTGAQTVAGVKTFNSSPVVPTASPGDNSTNAASTAYVDALNAVSGEYLPTNSSVTNVSSVSFDSCAYIRTGRIVHVTVHGTITMNTAGTLAVFDFSLPITPALGQNEVGNGTVQLPSAAPGYGSGIVDISGSTHKGAFSFWSTQSSGSYVFNVMLDYKL